MTTDSLYRFSGYVLLCAGVVGTIGHVIHPPGHGLVNVASSAWVPAHALILTSIVLAAIGVPALYARHHEQLGLLGLLGVILLAISFPLGAGTMMYEIFVVPNLVDVPSMQGNLAANGLVLTGPLQATILINFAALGIAFILMAIAVIRARVYSRFASMLMIVGGALLLATSEWFILVPIGITLAFIGLAWDGWYLIETAPN